MLFVVVFALVPKADLEKEEQGTLAPKGEAKAEKTYEPADDDVD